MDILLLFFALPISTIILSIVLQKVLKCPLLVAATFFAIYLIVTYVAFDSSFLVFVILYTILAYVTAVLTRLICNILERINRCCNNLDSCICNNSNSCNNTNVNNNGNTNELTRTSFTITSNQNDPVFFLTNRNHNTNNSRRNNCCCRR